MDSFAKPSIAEHQTSVTDSSEWRNPSIAEKRLFRADRRITWKPAALSIPALAVILSFAVAWIGLLQYASVKVPLHFSVANIQTTSVIATVSSTWNVAAILVPSSTTEGYLGAFQVSYTTATFFSGLLCCDLSFFSLQ